jgi:hypothetical protein
VVRNGRFVPRWSHVAVAGCVDVRNTDMDSYDLAGAGGAGAGAPVELPRRGTGRVCFPEAGVHRVRTSQEPEAGGFVIVDEALR